MNFFKKVIVDFSKVKAYYWQKGEEKKKKKKKKFFFESHGKQCGGRKGERINTLTGQHHT